MKGLKTQILGLGFLIPALAMRITEGASLFIGFAGAFALILLVVGFYTKD